MRGEKFTVVPDMFKELGQRWPLHRGNQVKTVWLDKNKEWRYASSKIPESFKHDLGMIHSCFKYASVELKFVAASES